MLPRSPLGGMISDMSPQRLALLLLLGSVGSGVSGKDGTGTSPVLAPGTLFRDCADCPEMVVVPAGTFTLGSPADEPGHVEDEGPQLEIRIDRPFAVGRFEVTYAQYDEFLKSTKHPVLGNCMTDRRKPGTWALDAKTNFHDPGFSQTPNHPAACVSWNDAIAYVAWLNSRTDGRYRLLTEAEWEYVARARSTTTYPWGASIDDGCADMNGFDKSILAVKGNLYQVEKVPYANCSDGYVTTSPVGSFRPNAFGVHDMIGNLGEWVQDCGSRSYAPTAAKDCSKRMVRGGSWGTQPRQMRTAERTRYSPGDLDDSIGIRVAKTLP